MKNPLYPPTILLPVKRIIAIGDLHGDYKATLLTLRKANLINSKNQWTGGETVVVQIGDQIDRGGRPGNFSDEDSEIKILNLFTRLHKQAKKRGGGVYSLLGNHELMNVFGNFDYTSAQGLKHFGGAKNRLEAFKPGGKIASKMALSRNVIMRIGNFVFVHGGISPNIAKKYKLHEINEMMRNFLQGKNDKVKHDRAFRELFINENSLLWNRKYADIRPDCKNLYKTLNILSADAMIVGHTPQMEGINCKCKSKIWRIDTGMSQAFGKRKKKTDRIQILEILGNGKEITVH